MEVHSHVFVIILLGLAFFATVILALVWAVKAGHFSNLEATSRSIFNEEEPEDQFSDTFPDNINNLS